MSYSRRALKSARIVVFVVIGISVLALHLQAQNLATPRDKREKTGYSIGVNIGRDMKNLGIDVDPDMVAQGFKDALAGKQRFTDDEMRTILLDLNKEMQAKQGEKIKTLADKNKKDSEEFLRENAKKEGIVSLPSGVQYKVVKEGNGKTPTINDTVVVHYKGALLDGTEFDSSYKRNQPAEFKVNAIIPGWTEALQKMKIGSRWLVYIPADQAYGERGAGSQIGPNAALMFDIELLSIK